MKKIVLLFAIVWIACYGIYAQGVNFAHGNWTEILAKAREEKKTIFVDVYTQWCGPCKKVARDVFPQEKMGEYFNPHFINYKVDAESPEGKQFVKQYPVTVYPTFFFIGEDGKVIHKFFGGKEVEGFLKEAKMLDMYIRYGGIDNMMAAIKNGTADRDLLYDYYQSANDKIKPQALNLYLKALPAEELMDVNNKLIPEISLYDKALLTRLIDEIIKVGNSEKYADKEFVKEFEFNICFPIQFDITGYINQSIKEGNSKWLDELLELKQRFAAYKGRTLDGDIKIIRGRGLFFATPEYIRLCYWTKNRENEEGFRTAMKDYMDKLILENPADSLLARDGRVTILKRDGFKGKGSLWAMMLFETGNITAHHIIDWTNYFWKISPSDKKTKALCNQWINYAYSLNPFNVSVAVPAADLSARIGNTKEAIAILETAIYKQKEIQQKDPKVFRALELKLRDVRNGKL